MLHRTLVTFACVCLASNAHAATIEWAGYTWQVSDGGMAGVCEADPKNVSVDQDGFLHLRISQEGGIWTAAEIFTTEKIGFGLYQWQVDGPIDTLDKNVVLGLFPYGPAAGIGGDGTNEIDIEYSRWGQTNGANGDWTNYPASGTVIGEHSYTFSLDGGQLSTSRFIWTSTSIDDFLFAGLQAPDSMILPLETWSYTPPNPNTNIPQQALPLGMNLWCFDSSPSNAQEVELVVRDFSYRELGSTTGTGGASAAGGSETVGTGGAGDGGAGEVNTGGNTLGPGGETSNHPSTGGALSSLTGGASAAAGGASGASAGASTEEAPGNDPGCGCRLQGRIAASSSTGSKGAVAWSILLALALLRRMRVRREAPARESAMPALLTELASL